MSEAELSSLSLTRSAMSRSTVLEHITIDHRGALTCTRCGATYCASEQEVREFRINQGPQVEWMKKHKQCVGASIN
jgi:hypothetical protein